MKHSVKAFTFLGLLCLLLSGCNSGPASYNYSDKWSYDENEHYHACIDPGFEHLRSDEEPHSFTETSKEATYEEEGKTIYTCSVCGYSYSVKKEDILEHHFSTEWSIDETHNTHYHACIDKGYEHLRSDEEEHSYDWTVDKEPTYTEEGHQHGTCVCGKQIEETMPATGTPDKLTFKYVEGECYVQASSTDIEGGKLIGLPWWKIWGLNASKAPNTTFTIGIDKPEVVLEKTKECADRFNILKVKVGLDNDYEMIETIRQVTNLPIAVDANQGWKDRNKALEEIHWLKEHGIVMVEQPMPKEMLDDTAWLKERSPLPIYADEAIQRLKDIPRIKGAYHGINIKLMKCTGMREAWKMANYAHAEGMSVMVGCMTETSCAVTAAAQISPIVDFADLDGNLLIANDRFKGMVVEKGRITLSDAPGLGLELL